MLTLSARHGIITLIPKKEKDPLLLGNWRPLTMLNVDHKIFAKALASRMKKVLPTIIHPDQTGFMQGRDIKDNIHRAIEIIEHVGKICLPAVLMSIDYHKCFDCIEHNSIWSTLRLFKFPDTFINMVQVLFHDFQSSIQCNGYLSQKIPIQRSVYQGSPIASFLFLGCAQLLHSLIVNNSNIHGITINDIEHLISQFADDTNLFFAV